MEGDGRRGQGARLQSRHQNPHTVADDHGEPEELLASLTAAEAETAKLRDQLKMILAEALAR